MKTYHINARNYTNYIKKIYGNNCEILIRIGELEGLSGETKIATDTELENIITECKEITKKYGGNIFTKAFDNYTTIFFRY